MGVCIPLSDIYVYACPYLTRAVIPHLQRRHCAPGHLPDPLPNPKPRAAERAPECRRLGRLWVGRKTGAVTSAHPQASSGL